jgi:hypothetical protein
VDKVGDKAVSLIKARAVFIFRQIAKRVEGLNRGIKFLQNINGFDHAYESANSKGSASALSIDRETS